MLGKRKKLSKKQIKEDKLVTTYYKVVQFYDQYQSKIIIAAGVIAVIIAAIFIYTSKQAENNLKANTQLSRILETYNNGEYQKAIDGQPGTKLIGLKSIVENYGGTENGEIARLFLAHSNYYLGNYDKALEQYNDFGGSKDMFKAAAMAGAAACYETMEQYEKAAEMYEDAAHVSENDPHNADYLVEAGDAYIKAGNQSKAREVLEKTKKDYPQSRAIQDANRYLAKLKF